MVDKIHVYSYNVYVYYSANSDYHVNEGYV